MIHYVHIKIQVRFNSKVKKFIYLYFSVYREQITLKTMTHEIV